MPPPPRSNAPPVLPPLLLLPLLLLLLLVAARSITTGPARSITTGPARLRLDVLPHELAHGEDEHAPLERRERLLRLLLDLGWESGQSRHASSF
jgi:hypothetical protein